jgi:hypothetical protein
MLTKRNSTFFLGFIFLIALTLIACTDERQQFIQKFASLTVNIDTTNFPKVTKAAFNSTALNYSGTIGAMAEVGGMLLLADMHDSMLLHIIRTDSFIELKKIVRRGNGKNELLNIANITIENDSIVWLHDITLNKLLRIDLNRACRDEDYSPDKEILLSGQCRGAISICNINKSLFAACSLVFGDCRYFTFSENSQVFTKVGELPPLDKSWPEENVPELSSLKALVYQANLVGKKNSNFFAVGYNSVSRLEIYDSMKLKKIIQGPNFEWPRYNFDFNNGGNIPVNIPDTRFAHMVLKADGQYIYSLFSGSDDFKTCGSSLLIFDWAGKPVQRILFNQDYCSFAIGYRDQKKVLYSVDGHTGNVVYSAIN